MGRILIDPIRAILFDLDGTLADTAGEMCSALERTFGELGLPPLAKPAVEALIGRGVASMVARALRLAGAVDADADAAVERFESHYARTVGTAAELYPGVRAGLDRLHAHGIPMGVVTNKPRLFAQRLLDRLDVRARFAALVAGDDGHVRKPGGAMLAAACREIGVAAADALMLGDSDHDVAAARAAGCRVWCVPYGYNEGRPAASLACDRLVPTVLDAADAVIGAHPRLHGS